MQFVKTKLSTTLNQLREMVGTENLESVLTINSLKRSPNIGQQVAKTGEAIANSASDVSLDFKKTALDRATQDSDVFESLALMGESGWKIYKAVNSLPNTLRIPETISLPLSQDIIGNSTRITDDIYMKSMEGLSNPPHTIDPSIFNTYDTKKRTQIVQGTARDYSNLFQFFKIPWGNMSIYSSIADDMKDFPVYPDEVSDGAKASYTQMPEIIYQYEPWLLYTSSGPRANTYSFVFHRDMWTGDHRDGKANELVRFCMANCYPEYNGSAVNSSTVTLYMNGQILISGVLTDVTVTWDGPLGLDGFYLVCKLQLSITEVSPYPLNYWSVMNKPLIG